MRAENFWRQVPRDFSLIRASVGSVGSYAFQRSQSRTASTKMLANSVINQVSHASYDGLERSDSI